MPRLRTLKQVHGHIHVVRDNSLLPKAVHKNHLEEDSLAPIKPTRRAGTASILTSPSRQTPVQNHQISPPQTFPKGLFSSLNIKNFVSIVALTSLISFEVSDDTDIKLASFNCNVLLMK